MAWSTAATPPLKIKNRGGEIRTHGLLLPKQALYQAKLRPEKNQERSMGAI